MGGGPPALVARRRARGACGLEYVEENARGGTLLMCIVHVRRRNALFPGQEDAVARLTARMIKRVSVHARENDGRGRIVYNITLV